ncbi:hypothetical protein GQ42DRAFT_157448 [Ramicandelaber brevisporus]|nr:hypothetical protein GQ42DRAFT_157448 [Ramicandelaber brevisporus]
MNPLSAVSAPVTNPARRHQVARLAARLCGQIYHDPAVRDGSKYLLKPMKAPKIANYYPDPATTSFRIADFRAFAPEVKWMDMFEALRMDNIEYRHRTGKQKEAKGRRGNKK